MRIDLMTDLETLGTENDAPILSIGACKFNIETGEILSTFYTVFGWDAALKQPGRKPCKNTMAWWSEQNKLALAAIKVKPQCDFDEGLNAYVKYVGHDMVYSWSNGSNFDVEIMEHAFKQCRLPVPWKFWNIRDVRTLVDVGSHLYDKSMLKFEGTQHNALDDAVHQAKYVSEIWRRIKQ